MALSQKRGYVFDQNYNYVPYDSHPYYTVNECGDKGNPTKLVILKCEKSNDTSTCGKGYLVFDMTDSCSYGFSYFCGKLPTYKPLVDYPISNLTQQSSCYPNFCDSCVIPFPVAPAVDTSASQDFLLNYEICGSQCFTTQSGTNCPPESCSSYGPYSLSYNKGLSPSEIGQSLPVIVNSTTQIACLYYTTYYASSWSSSFGGSSEEYTNCTHYCGSPVGFYFSQEIRNTYSGGISNSYSSRTSVTVTLTNGPGNPISGTTKAATGNGGTGNSGTTKTGGNGNSGTTGSTSHTTGQESTGNYLSSSSTFLLIFIVVHFVLY